MFIWFLLYAFVTLTHYQCEATCPIQRSIVSHGEDCSFNLCNSDLGLSCNENKFCECDNGFNWLDGQSCVASFDSSSTQFPCDTRLFLVSSNDNVCVCDDDRRWDGSICLKPFDYVLKLFYGSSFDFSKKTIRSYNGASFSGLADISFSPYTNNFYLSDLVQSKVIRLNENLNFVNSNNFNLAYSVEFLVNNYYITGQASRIIYRTNLNFNVLNTYTAPSGGNMLYIRYSKSSNKLYACDYGLKKVRLFDTNLNHLESFSVVDCISVIPLENDIVFVGSDNGKLHVYQNGVRVTTYNVCQNGKLHGMYTDVDTYGIRYLMMSCFSDKKVYLYTIDGTVVTNTNKFVATSGSPVGLAVDINGLLAVSEHNPYQVETFLYLVDM